MVPGTALKGADSAGSTLYPRGRALVRVDTVVSWSIPSLCSVPVDGNSSERCWCHDNSTLYPHG